jgi:predicted DNA-binding transcriptional regulator YafY
MAKKISILFDILKIMQQGNEICMIDTALQNRLNISERNLYRYMEDIRGMFQDIIVKETKLTAHSRKSAIHYRICKDKINDNIKVLKYLTEQGGDTAYLLNLIQANDPKLFEEYDKSKIGKNLSADRDIFYFKANPFEEAKHKSFAIIQKAIKQKEYRSIKYESELFENVKCLKLVFTDNNWYLLGEYLKNIRLFRISFIEEVCHPHGKAVYAMTKELQDRCDRFLNTMQNAMSLFDKPRQKAILRASANVSRYFKNDMKKFFSSQSFIKETESGSVEFSVLYTQDMEILPFIKRWLPDIEIVEPQELRHSLYNDIQKALKKLDIS